MNETDRKEHGETNQLTKKTQINYLRLRLEVIYYVS